MLVESGQELHRTTWTLYPFDRDQVRHYDPVDTPVIRMEGRNYAPESWRIMCPHCGDVWASRLLCDEPNDHWQVRRWPCWDCGGGSLWDAWQPPWNRSLGWELLCREMDLIKDWHDRGIRTYNQYFSEVRFRRKV